MENRKVIANTYEIIGQLGAGGVGVIFLAEHLRLHTKVVLKADKRSSAGRLHSMRSEVDALKNLNNIYIPKVYDFIEEDGITYTVMDYIDGESFDKSLKRGVRYSSAQITKWACQLLEALVYLHSRPPNGILHADIKPANIVLRNSGDISLIDFNISLVLGEEGAIAVGRSFGYASPEHYGEAFQTNRTVSQLELDAKTEVDAKTVLDTIHAAETVIEDNPHNGTSSSSSGSSSGSSSRRITIDVRSDIYSLGATLYHLIGGVRPAQKAGEVIRLKVDGYPKAILDIVEKAMNPDIELRYQSAAEMLEAFQSLGKNDIRTKRYNRIKGTLIGLNVLTYMAAGGAVVLGLQQMEQWQNKYVQVEYAENALANGDVDLAIAYALESIADDGGMFAVPEITKAQQILAEALGVYDLSDGYKEVQTIDLDAAPLYMEFSPNGETLAIFSNYEWLIMQVSDGTILYRMNGLESALCEAHYLDETNLLYAGENGVVYFDINEGKEVYVVEEATGIALSEDKKTMATVNRDATEAKIYDVATGTLQKEVDFAGLKQSVATNNRFANPNDNVFALNADGSYLGVSFSNGSLWAYNLLEEDADVELFDNTSGFTHFEGGFHEQYFAFSGTNTDNSLFAVIDLEEMVQTGGFASENYFGVQTDGSGIYINTENLLVQIDPVTGAQIPLITTTNHVDGYDAIDGYTVVASDNKALFFDKYTNLISDIEKVYSIDFVEISDDFAVVGSMNSPTIQILEFESHLGNRILQYSPEKQYDEARIAHDWNTAMMFSYDEFAIYDMSGEVIAVVEIPNAENVYDQQFRRTETESYLEVTYYDGMVMEYSATNGILLREYQSEIPDESLYEEFFTEKYRIASPLHGGAEVYLKDTDELFATLEKDAYLTYVTEVNGYIITEYITTAGERYGLLLDSNCEILAKLPNLTDIIEGQLIFHYPSGDLKKTVIYGKEDLMEMANKGERD